MIVFNNSQSVISLDLGRTISLNPFTMCNLSKHATEEQIKNSKRLKEFLALGYLVPMRPDAKVFKIQNTLQRMKKAGHVAVYIPAFKDNVDKNTKKITRKELVQAASETKKIEVAAATVQKDITNALQQLKTQAAEVNESINAAKRCKGVSNTGQPCKKTPIGGYQYCLIHLPDEQRKQYEKQRGPTFSSIFKDKN